MSTTDAQVVLFADHPWGEQARPFGVSIVGGGFVEAPEGLSDYVRGRRIEGEHTDVPDKEGAPAFRTFDPERGVALEQPYFPATQEETDEACRLAWNAFVLDRERPPTDRAALLLAIAQRLEEIRTPLVRCACRQTGLAEARVQAEFSRTSGTLKLYARTAADPSWLRVTHDRADPHRTPVARPELRQVLRPLGPVAVFGASNFPLAYSTAGGDTASALAAGCPVVVKGHPLHAGAGELAAQAVARAVNDVGLHPGTFAFLHAGGQRERNIGEQVVRHACVRAVGFTGSLAAGRAITEVAQSRHDPIPTFCEMGSVNPVFVLPGSARERPESAEAIAQSIVSSAGQQCTCPGLIFMIDGEATEQFLVRMGRIFAQADSMVMLAPRVQQRYATRIGSVAGLGGVQVVSGATAVRPHAGSTVRVPTPAKGPAVLFRTTYETFRSQLTLHEEIFGPAAVVVTCPSERELFEAAGLLMGSLTASVFWGDDDVSLAAPLSGLLEQRVGRLVFQGVPTGVEVVESMVHGGPYPASNQAHTTAVGPRSLYRWCRPVCYQNAPSWALPDWLSGYLQMPQGPGEAEEGADSPAE